MWWSSKPLGLKRWLLFFNLERIFWDYSSQINLYLLFCMLLCQDFRGLTVNCRLDLHLMVIVFWILMCYQVLFIQLIPKATSSLLAQFSQLLVSFYSYLYSLLCKNVTYLQSFSISYSLWALKRKCLDFFYEASALISLGFSHEWKQAL